VGARVQSAVAVDRLGLALEVFAGERLYLTLTADPAAEGVLLDRTKARRGAVGATPLLEAARSRLVGTRVASVTSPRHERCLTIRFAVAGSDPAADRGPELVAELMGRMANLAVLDADGTVIALARTITQAMTRARVLKAGAPYQPPPPPDKADPDTATAVDVEIWLRAGAAADEAMPAWRALVKHVRGIGPLAAREVVWRACGDVGMRAGDAADDAATVHGALAGLISDLGRGAARPTVARRGLMVVAWAPYWLGHLEAHEGQEQTSVEATDSAMDALAAFEAARSVPDPYAAARLAIDAELEAAAVKLRRKRDSLSRQIAGTDPAALERLRLCGDLVLAYQTTLSPGQTILEAQASADPDAPPLRIRLDPALSAVENAQRYYASYKRSARAAKAVPVMLRRAEAGLAMLEQLRTDLRLAEDRADIDAVAGALDESGLTPRRGRSPAKRSPRSAPRRPPLQLVSDDGFVIWVGRNSRQNEEVTFKRAARGDLWLHARDVPGAHVVVKSAGASVPDSTIGQAAALAAWFSAEQDAAAVDVAVTDVRHVRRLGGGGPGMVRFENATTVTIRPQSPAALGF